MPRLLGGGLDKEDWGSVGAGVGWVGRGRPPKSQQGFCWLSRQGHSREGPGTKLGTVDPGRFGRSTSVVHQSAYRNSPSSLMCRGHVQGPPPQAPGRASSWTLGSAPASVPSLPFVCRGKLLTRYLLKSLLCGAVV